MKKDKKDFIKKIVAAAILGFISGLIVYFAILKPDLPEKTQPGKKVSKKQRTKPTLKSPYTGEVISEETYKNRPLAVVIENHTVARPQSGLSKADWVFEVVAEGGITRLLAVFHSRSAESIGPVRSAREYFAHLAKSIDAIFVHIGGSPSGYDAINNLNLTNIDGISASKPFKRISERKAPHNLYTSTEALRKYADAKGYTGLPVEPGYDFTGGSPSATQKVKEFDLDFSSPKYKVTYKYDDKTNRYTRFTGGVTDKDLRTGLPIQPSNIVVIVTDITSTDEGKGRMKVTTEGTGEALIFNNGTVTLGQWERPDPYSAFKFKDRQGNNISFVKGQTWFEILPSADRVKYQIEPEPQQTTPTSSITE